MSDWSLPAALRPWHHWLQWFRPDVAVALGDLVRQLDTLPGLAASRLHDTSVTEPDGLDDLRHRGPYPRLLASEWLLAEAAPDEFLRRAVMGEHLFLMPRPRSRQVDRLILALFDAGPHQLGAPRLAHLAAWILLARRAEQAGATLRWGVLQQPGALHEAREVRNLHDLLKQRGWTLPTPAHLQQWQQSLADAALNPAACWQVGSPSAGAMPQASHRLGIARALQGSDLDVLLETRTRRSRLQLPLPPEPLAQDILKGRFAPTAASNAHQKNSGRLSIKQPPILSPAGRHVAVRLLDAPGVMVFPIPGTNHARGKARRQLWPDGAQPLALLLDGRTALGVLRQSGQTLAWQAEGIRLPTDLVPAPAGSAALQPAACLTAGRQRQLLLLTADNALLCAKPASGGKPPVPETLASNVLAITQVGKHRLACAWREADRLHIRQYDTDPDDVQVTLGPVGQDVAVLLNGIASRPEVFGGAAVCDRRPGEAETWRVYPLQWQSGGPLQSLEWTLPPGWRAIGMFDRSIGDDSALLLIDAGNERLARWDQDGLTTLYTLPAAAVRLSYSPISGQVALLTGQQQLIVYSLAEQVLKLFIHEGSSEDASH